MQSTQITPTPATPSETTPLPAMPAQTTPAPTTPIQTTAPEQTYWSGTTYDDRMQRRIERRAHYQAAGVPVWGVLLILIGAIALVGNLGIDLGWIFGLALGAWFVYLGVRHVPEGGAVNWWLTGLGLLIGLGAISSGFLVMDKLVFPVVLIIVGLGIMAEYTWSHQNQNR